MELIGHRGCGAVYPENTVEAVRRAAEQLPAVEIDVRRCASGELVCCHDETVDRVTDGEGQVEDLVASELDELAGPGTDEPVPRLEAVVAAVPQILTLQIELKDVGIGGEVLESVRPRRSIRLSSFDPAALKDVGDRDVPTGLLFRGDPWEHLSLATSLACANVHPHWRDCVESTIVEEAHNRGFGVYAWGIESDPAALEATRRAGVDGATVDRPDLDSA